MSALSEAIADGQKTLEIGTTAENVRPVAANQSTAVRAFLAVVDQAIVSATNFLTAIIIGRCCTKHELGIYSLGFSVLLLLRGVQYQLISAPYMIYWSRQPRSERAAYLGSTLTHQLLLIVLISAGLFVQLSLIPAGVASTELVPVLWILLFGAPLLLLREFFRNLALSHLRMGHAIAIDAAVAAVQLGVLLSFVGMHRLTIPVVFIGMVLACLVPCLAWLKTVPQRVRFERSRWWPDWTDNWCFGKWALMSHLVGGSTPYLMPWIVAVAHGEAAAGVLAAASTLVGLSNTLVIGLGNFLTPRAALAYSEGGIRSMLWVLLLFGFVFVATLGAFCLLIAMFGDPLTVWIYGDRYRGIGTVSTLLGLTVLANSLRMTVGTGLWAIERPRANFWADLCTMLVTVAVALICVGRLGVLGAAIGMVAGAMVGAIAGFIMLAAALARLRATPESVAWEMT